MHLILNKQDTVMWKADKKKNIHNNYYSCYLSANIALWCIDKYGIKPLIVIPKVIDNDSAFKFLE